jgi:hypothetical protein
MTSEADLPGVSRCCSPSQYQVRSTADRHDKFQWLGSSFQTATRAAQSQLVAFHDSTGLPWWSTLALCGASLRVVCMPLAIKASAVGSNLFSGQRNAMRLISHLIGEPPIATLTPALADRDARKRALAPILAPGSTNRLWVAAPLLQVRAALAHAIASSSSCCAERLHQECQYAGGRQQLPRLCQDASRAPSPCRSTCAHWLQIPILFTAIAAVSTLAHPGLASEGLLWFPNLEASALSWRDAVRALSTSTTPLNAAEVQALRAVAAPMGVPGCSLPVALWLVLRANISRTVEAGMHFSLAAFGSGKGNVAEGTDRAVVRGPGLAAIGCVWTCLHAWVPGCYNIGM